MLRMWIFFQEEENPVEVRETAGQQRDKSNKFFVDASNMTNGDLSVIGLRNMRKVTTATV